MRKFFCFFSLGVMSLSHAAAYENPHADNKVKAEASMLASLFAKGGYLQPPAAGELSPLSVPPPAQGSALEALDLAKNKEVLTSGNVERWNLAIADAALYPDQFLGGFSAAAGLNLADDRTPHLRKLLTMALVDFARSTSETKKAYARPRPFTINGQKAAHQIGSLICGKTGPIRPAIARLVGGPP